MKPSSPSSSFAIALLLGTLTLVGCGGALNFPDSVASSQAAGPPIQGRVFGGHAPVQGSHVYLLQPGVTAAAGTVGSAATSILGVGTGTTGYPGYPLAADATDPNVPIGSEYVTTDSNGAFNLTGAYVCTAGEPVYLYAWGGEIGTVAATPTTVTLTITAATQTHSGGAYVYTFTALNNSPVPLAAGKPVTLALTGGTGWTTLTTGSVYSETSTGFVVHGTTAVTGTATGTATYTYTTSANAGAQNKSIVELATLGNCPTSGALNFGNGSSDPISFIYMNEVSTVAAAYTFQPFTLATHNDAWHVGTDGTTQALLGIHNAAATAAQLYNIQGGTQLSGTGDGEGHLANYQTQLNGVANQGNGVVPQATIDSLANILAACIDSTPVGGGGPSAQCTDLFRIATNNGETGTTGVGTNEPTDTAAAAINIARYPAGNHSAGAGNVDATYAQDLFAVPDGTVPYAPDLVNPPNDWTIVINYPYATVSPTYDATNSALQKAESIAVDQTGEIWITAQTDFAILRWSPLGVQNSYYSSASNYPGPNSYIYGYVSIDGNNNAWAGNYAAATSIQEFNSNGIQINLYGSGYYTSYTVVADMSGNAYFFASNETTGDTDTYGTWSSTVHGNSEMWEYNSGGTLVSSSAKCDGVTGPFVYNCISQPTGTSIFNTPDYVAHGAIEGASATTLSPLSKGHLWLTSEASPYQIARVSPAGVADFVFSGIQQPEFPSIDANGNAWIATQENTSYIYKVTPTTTTPFYTSTQLSAAETGAELYNTFGSAVDGNGNIWFANRCAYNSNGGTCPTTPAAGANSIIELNGANQLAISPPTNYYPEAQYPANATTFTPILNDSLNLAIDPSGNIWITNYLGGSVAEIVGAAAPVVTPLSVAAGTNKLGVKP